MGLTPVSRRSGGAVRAGPHDDTDIPTAPLRHSDTHAFRDHPLRVGPSCSSPRSPPSPRAPPRRRRHPHVVSGAGGEQSVDDRRELAGRRRASRGRRPDLSGRRRCRPPTSTTSPPAQRSARSRSSRPTRWRQRDHDDRHARGHIRRGSPRSRSACPIAIASAPDLIVNVVIRQRDARARRDALRRRGAHQDRRRHAAHDRHDVQHLHRPHQRQRRHARARDACRPRSPSPPGSPSATPTAACYADVVRLETSEQIAGTITITPSGWLDLANQNQTVTTTLVMQRRADHDGHGRAHVERGHQHAGGQLVGHHRRSAFARRRHAHHRHPRHRDPSPRHQGERSSTAAGPPACSRPAPAGCGCRAPTPTPA